MSQTGQSGPGPGGPSCFVYPLNAICVLLVAAAAASEICCRGNPLNCIPPSYQILTENMGVQNFEYVKVSKFFSVSLNTPSLKGGTKSRGYS